MPKKEQGWITFQSSPEERQILDAYSRRCHRSKTEILRELIRNIGDDAAGSPEIFTSNPKLKISARNVFKGRITRIVMSAVNTEIEVEIAPGVTLTSVITTSSAEQLNLKVKQTVYAVIKSNNVTLAEIVEL